jgi:hypothetical protein
MPNPSFSVPDFVKLAVDRDPSDFQQQILGQWDTSVDRKLRQLAEDCCRDYDRRCDMSEEPSNPMRSKPGFPTFSQIAREEITAHYEEARFLGFEGSTGKWAQMVYDSRPPEKEKHYAHSR